MAFKEKSAWIVLAALLWIFGGYGWSLYQAGSFGAGTTAVMIASVIGFVVVIVVGHIVVAIFSARPGDEAGDERDQRIELKSETAAGLVLGSAAFAALVVALLRGEYLVANILFLGLAASEIVKCLWQIALYRRSS
jgi:hypothetical protein